MTSKPHSHRPSLIVVCVLALGCEADLPTTRSTDPADGADNRFASEHEVQVTNNADLAAGRDLYIRTCAACHGNTGRGDGRASAELYPNPRDFTKKAWQDSVDNDYLRRIIVSGGTAVGKSPLMPGSRSLANKPAVLAGLVAYLRAFAEQTDSHRNP